MSPPVPTSDSVPPSPPSGGRASRVLLFAPMLALGLLAAGWSAFWFVVRGQVEQGLDRFVSDRAAEGLKITCDERSLSGFPFRIELRCARLTLARGEGGRALVTEIGPLVAVSQTHRLGHAIVQSTGPVAMRWADGTRVDLSFSALEASYRLHARHVERVSAVVTQPHLLATRADQAQFTTSAARLDVHARPQREPDSQSPAPGAPIELSATVEQVVSGPLDALLGDSNPGSINLAMIATRPGAFAGGFTPAGFDAWRMDGGRILVQRLALSKGLKRIEARGELALDEERRLAGRLEPAVANIDQIGGMRINAGALDLAAALSGRQPGEDGLKPLPALVARQGRVMLGPIRLPLPPLQPLYQP